MPENILKLKGYLLGKLSDAEIEVIDLRVISDERFSEELSLAESELIEDHLEGAFSDDDARLFYSTFLVSPDRRELMREISLLRNYALRPDVQQKQIHPQDASSWSIIGLLKGYLRPLALGTAIVVLLVVGLLWSGYLGGSGSALEKQYAELNRRDLSNTNESSGFSSVSLSAGSFRDGNPSSKQNAEQLTETVMFRLIFPSKLADGSAFKAKVSRGSASVFTIDAAKVYQNSSGQDVRLLLPKSILQKGEYQIKLEGASGAEAGTFSFVIE